MLKLLRLAGLLAAFAVSTSAFALSSDPTELKSYFRFDKTVAANIPATSDDWTVVKLSISAPSNISSPGEAIFTLPNGSQANYHYEGYSDNAHQYLVAVPNNFSGVVDIGVYLDLRGNYTSTLKKTKDDLVRNTVILGANDIVLVVDSSGSMRNYDRMDLATRVVNEIGPKLEAAGNNVGVIDYDGSVRITLNLDDKFRNQSFSAGGGTYTSGAIAKAIEMLDGRPSAGKIILVITDGAPASRANVNAQIDKIVALKDQGWAIAGLGMGMSFTNYPINQEVPNNSSAISLGSTIENLIKTAEESIRDVNDICSGDKCNPIANDQVPPTIDLSFGSLCTVPGSESDLLFDLKDGRAGINESSVKFELQLDGSYVNLPMSKTVKVSQSGGLSPLEIRYTLDTNAISQNAILANFMEMAFRTRLSAGGQTPFNIRVSATDQDGNQLSRVINIDPRVKDTTPPSITLETGGKNDVLRHTGDLFFSAQDDMTGIDPRYDVSLKFSYNGKTAEVDVSNYAASESYPDSCYARQPLVIETDLTEGPVKSPEVMSILSDAFNDDSDISITAEVTDWVGNKRAKTITVHFAPERYKTDKMAAPGLAVQFLPSSVSTPYGLKLNPEDLIQEVTVDSVGYYARMSKATDTPVKLNGIELSRETAQYLGEFDLSNSLHFNLSGIEDLKEGTGEVVLIPDTPGVRSIQIPTELWLPHLSSKVSNENPIQLFERTEITLEQSNPVACTTTNSEMQAEAADNINSPKCLIEWTQLPVDIFATSNSPAAATGYAPETGKQTYSYIAYIFDGAGNKYKMDEGEGEFTVSPAKDHLDFAIDDLDHTYRIIAEARSKLEETSAKPLCSTVTIDADELLDQTMINRPGCLITWNYIPPGMEQLGLTNQPTVKGYFNVQEGDTLFRWTVSSYTKSGELIELMTQEQIIPLDNPPTPEVTFDDNLQIAEDVYAVEKDGGIVSYFSVKAANATILVDYYENGSIIDQTTLYPTYGRDIEFRRPLFIDPKNLWDRTALEVKARYQLIESLEGSAAVEVISIPDENISPEISVSSEEAINTEDFDAKTLIANPYAPDAVYDPEEMATWDVRLVNFISFNTQEPLSDFEVNGTDGSNEFSFDLLGIDSSFMRVSAEAVLHSPHPEYQLTKTSRKPIYVTILRGEAIKSSLTGKRLKGEAKLPVFVKLDLESTLDYKALGDIEWQIRKDGSSEWGEEESAVTNFDRFYHFFEAGEYDLRAVVHNKNTPATFTTETVHIFAYNVPKLRIEGPSNAFIGSQAKMRLDAKLMDGTPVDESDLIIEWSEDNGETWTPGGAEYILTRDVEERVMLEVRARMKESPEDWEDAFDNEKVRVNFRPVREPRAGFYGPRVIEKDEKVDWLGVVTTPYPNMDVEVGGRFILPDGSIVEGNNVSYVATDADVEKERIEVTYEAWISGFEDQGGISETTRQINVWRYDWPNWLFYTRATAEQAPAEITLMVYNPAGSTRYIEGLNFEWFMPPEAEVLRDTTDETRVIAFDKAGTYPITIRISDDRGNFSEITKEITLSPADDWDIDLRLMPSNQYYNAPLEMRVMPSIDGGHPRDRVSNYVYEVDGQQVSDGDRYANLVFEKEGTYDITLLIESRQGETAEKTVPVTVFANKKPTCELEHSSNRNRHQFKLNCSDEDGRIYGYEWLKDGEDVGVRGSRLSLTNRDNDAFTITARGIDNGGLYSDDISYTFMPEVTAESANNP